VLYALHLAIKNHHWPATNPAWLLALYSVFVFIPITVQLIAPYVTLVGTWAIIAGLSARCVVSGFSWPTALQVTMHLMRHGALSWIS